MLATIAGRETSAPVELIAKSIMSYPLNQDLSKSLTRAVGESRSEYESAQWHCVGVWD